MKPPRLSCSSFILLSTLIYITDKRNSTISKTSSLPHQHKIILLRFLFCKTQNMFRPALPPLKSGWVCCRLCCVLDPACLLLGLWWMFVSAAKKKKKMREDVIYLLGSQKNRSIQIRMMWFCVLTSKTSQNCTSFKQVQWMITFDTFISVSCCV